MNWMRLHRTFTWYGIAALALVVLAGMVACSKNVDVTTEDEDDGWTVVNSNVPVRFSTSLKTAATRGALPANTTFGVFAFYSSGNIGNLAPNNKPNFMYNEDVHYDGSTYTYAPVKYWPNTGRLSFWAYAPYDANPEVLAPGTSTAYTNDTKGMPDIRFTVTDGQTDFLIASPSMNNRKPNADAPVSLTFNHALSDIDFKVKKVDAGGNYTVVLKSISFSYIYLSGDYRNSTGTWIVGRGGTAALPVFSGNQTVTTSEAVVVDNLGETAHVMPIPQDVSGDLIEAKLRIVYTQQIGSSTPLENVCICDLSGSWVKNMHYTYKITITPNLPIEFTVDKFPWGDNHNIYIDN